MDRRRMPASARVSALALPFALAVPVVADAAGQDAAPGAGVPGGPTAALAPAPIAALSDAFAPGTAGDAAREARAKVRKAQRKVVRHARLTQRGNVLAPSHAPRAVRRVIAAANRISRKPYVWGGGHGNWNAPGYDCSGSVSYALHGGRLLKIAMASGGFTGWGRPGKGRWITVYANGGHAYMVVAGMRYDTTAFKAGGNRWTSFQRPGAGYVARHPAGL
jgi:hypothetical protein